MQTELSRHDATKATLLNVLPSPEQLNRWAKELRTVYAANQPFPHIVIDDFLPPRVAREMLEVFPKPEAPIWMRTSIQQEKKLSVSEELSIPSPLLEVLYALNGATFLKFLEDLTGIEGLIPDPYFNGGGLHQIEPGGKLGIHIDFNKYPKLKLDRRINLLVYLNPDWQEEYGGHLELWEDARTGKGKKVLPLFNRCVIFSTDEKSLHGHPEPLKCPTGNSRKSIAMYYYTVGRPRAERGFIHGTVFFEKTPELSRVQKLRLHTLKFIRAVTPPFLYELTKKCVAKIRG